MSDRIQSVLKPGDLVEVESAVPNPLRRLFRWRQPAPGEGAMSFRDLMESDLFRTNSPDPDRPGFLTVGFEGTLVNPVLRIWEIVIKYARCGPTPIHIERN